MLKTFAKVLAQKQPTDAKLRRWRSNKVDVSQSYPRFCSGEQIPVLRGDESVVDLTGYSAYLVPIVVGGIEKALAYHESDTGCLDVISRANPYCWYSLSCRRALTKSKMQIQARSSGPHS